MNAIEKQVLAILLGKVNTGLLAGLISSTNWVVPESAFSNYIIIDTYMNVKHLFIRNREDEITKRRLRTLNSPKEEKPYLISCLMSACVALRHYPSQYHQHWHEPMWN